MATKPVEVVKDQDNPQPDVVLAKHIEQISQSMKQLTAGPLQHHTIVLLVQNHSRVGKRDVEAVLYSLNQLASYYLKPKTTSAK